MATNEELSAAEKERDAAWVRVYELEAKCDRLRGEPLSEEFHEALAASHRGEPGSKERRDRAYTRLQASRVIVQPAVLAHIAEEDRPAVLAEVERMRTEQTAACIHEDDGGPFFAKCGKCGETLDAGGDS